MFTQIVKDPNAGIGVLKIASLSFKKAAAPAALSFLIDMQHGLSHNTKKAPKIGAFKSAADRNRTGTGITTHGILSPGRLPVPPLRLIYMCTTLIRTIRASTVPLANYHTYKRRKKHFLLWMEVDSNLFAFRAADLSPMDGGGFEPPKQFAADLQSVPFGHSGIHPNLSALFKL